MIDGIHYNNSKRIAIWGTGAYGAIATRGLKEKYDTKPSYFVDFNKANQGSYFLDVPVISPEDISSKDIDQLFICALNHDYIEKKYSEEISKIQVCNPRDILLDIDYSKVDNKFTINRLKTLAEQLVFSINAYKSVSSTNIELNSVDLVVTERCTLKCKDCSNLMQYYTKPETLEEASITEEVDILLSLVDKIHEIRVIGGEPLLNKGYII